MSTKEYLEKISNRDDARWSHPECKDVYQAGFEQSSDALYDQSIPFETRKAMAEKAKEMYPPIPPVDESRMNVYYAPGCPEEPDAKEVKIYVAYPEKRRQKMPCVFSIISGGLIISAPEYEPLIPMADTYQAVYVSFVYRTIFDEKGAYPGTVNDCHAAYQYIYNHADELGIDADKIVITGASSGGHLSLALCHRLKKYGYSPRGCVSIEPIPDERLIYGSSKLCGCGWVGKSMNLSSTTWLKGLEGDEVPPEAFANHASVEDCVGLPPTFIHTMENDPCADPSMAYASKLREAGVYTEIHMWGGTNHVALPSTARMNPESEYGQRYQNCVDSNIKDCIKYDLRRQWLAE